MFETLTKTIEKAGQLFVSDERKEILQPLIDFIQSSLDDQKPVNLNFICTHNSRRSHLSQIWAQTMAEFFGINNITCYSGGTEATAMFPKVAETFIGQGFEIAKLSETDNPVYAVKFNDITHPVIAFSKKYDDAFNPVSDFAAIMTCDNADQGCPFIPGAAKRIPIKYKDPKASDGTPEMDTVYAERSWQIASEMYHVFSNLKKK